MEDRKPTVYFDGTKLVLAGGTILLLPIIPLLFWYYMYLQLVLTLLFFTVVAVSSLSLVLFVVGSLARATSQVLGAASQYQKLRKLQIENKNLDLVPDLIQAALSRGLNVKFKGVEISDWKSNMHTLHSGTEASRLALEGPMTSELADLPTYVTYESICDQIPDGHVLVGILADRVVTKPDRLAGACTWICGLSGSGKTTTATLRVHEKAVCGHSFLGYDPHWFKDDSLTNALTGYAKHFIRPMARSVEDAIEVFTLFLDEFKRRKAGQTAKPFQKWTLIVDEVNAINDPQSEEEKKLLELLKTIVRITGQESRNFEMAGIYCSQQATGLYWIRNVALLIIIHKLIMENQQKVATNLDDKKFFAGMRTWPKGRTYVYGAGLEEGEGCQVMQQPFLENIPQGTWQFDEMMSLPNTQTVVSDVDLVREAVEKLLREGKNPSVREVSSLVPFGKTKVAEILQEI